VPHSHQTPHSPSPPHGSQTPRSPSSIHSPSGAQAHVNEEKAFKAIHRIAVLNAVLCFIFVIIYFRVTALHKYAKTTWDYSVSYNDRLALPAFAFIGGGSWIDRAMANFVGTFTKCTFPQYLSECPALAFNNSPPMLNISTGVYRSLQAYVFDPRGLDSDNNGITDLSNRVDLQVNMNCTAQNLSNYDTKVIPSNPLFR
jgi:hypothetical protein